MLEGLEISEILKSSISFENVFFRIDSQYFKKEYLKEDSNRKKYENSYLGQIAFITDGQHGYHEVDENSPIRHLTAKNAKGWFANDIDADRIAKWVDDNNRRSSLEKDDLILSTRGTVGLCAIVDSDVLPSNIDQDVARIKFENKKLLPTVALTYLNCKVGQDWLERNQTGMVQQGIALWRVREIPLPIFTDKFQKIIDGIIKDSKNHKNNSKEAYFNAEALLLETIGINNFEPSTDGVNVKSYKESFLTSGRLDSEYYQKRYDILENHFDSFDRKRIGDFITHPVASGVTPKAGGDDYTDAESGIPFIRAVDLKNGEVTTENFIYIKPEIHNGILKRTQLKKGDVLFSIAGTVGRCSLFDHSFEANINQAVSILRFDDKFIKRLYLIVFFNSEIGKEFVSRYSRQGVQTNLNLAEVADLRVPIIDYTQQEKIAALVEESFRLKKQSEQLLETAKRAVEIAIEQDEEAAMKFIVLANN